LLLKILTIFASDLIWLEFAGTGTFLVAGGVDEMTLEKRFNGSGFRVQRLTLEPENFASNEPKASNPDANIVVGVLMF